MLYEKGRLIIMINKSKDIVLKPINKEKYNPNKNKKQVDAFE